MTLARVAGLGQLFATILAPGDAVLHRRQDVGAPAVIGEGDFRIVDLVRDGGCAVFFHIDFRVQFSRCAPSLAAPCACKLRPRQLVGALAPLISSLDGESFKTAGVRCL